MNELLYAASLLPSVITAMLVFYMQRGQKRRDQEADARMAARKKEYLLSLDIQVATSKMAYASAMAIKRGSTNGEMEDALVAYAKAKKAWVDFMNEQAKERMMEE